MERFSFMVVPDTRIYLKWNCELLFCHYDSLTLIWHSDDIKRSPKNILEYYSTRTGKYLLSFYVVNDISLGFSLSKLAHAVTFLTAHWELHSLDIDRDTGSIEWGFS
jgi:hypothetical protein